MESGDALKGNLHAIEVMLTQLYSMALLNVELPQPWINENTVSMAAKIGRSESLSSLQKEAAYGTIRRVMQMTSWDAESQGKGRALNLVTPPRRDEEA
jgi:hypothetical protein